MATARPVIGDDGGVDVEKAAFLLSYRYMVCRGMNHAFTPEGHLRPYHVGGDSPRQVLEEWAPCARKLSDGSTCPVVKKTRYLPRPNRRRGRYQPKYILVLDSEVIDYPADGSYRADPGLNLRRSDIKTHRAQKLMGDLDLGNLGWATK